MLRKLLTNALMVVLFAIAGIMLVPAALGYHRYVILTGSMTGTYDAGSIVFDKPVPTSSLKVGDTITYAPPPGASPNQKLVTHRIHRVLPGPGGQRAFVTKGDANARPDAWRFTLPQPTQDTVRFHVPYAGYIFMFLSVREFRTALIGLPALLIAGWLLLGLWREGGNEVRRRRDGVRPWGAAVAERLPSVVPPVALEAAAAARASVNVPVSWPAPEVGAGRGRIRAGFATPLARPRVVRAGEPGVVALPPGCLAHPRRVTERRRGRAAAPWTLTIDPQL